MSRTRLPPLPSIRDILKLYRLSAVKHLSQNFLMDEKLSNKIVKFMGKIGGSEVLEVGPGPGIITRSILRKSPKKLVLVEKDKRFEPTLEMLREAFSSRDTQVELIFNDIMNINMSNMFASEETRHWEDECPNIHLVGNLPFSISTALIIKWLQHISQKEGAWLNGRVRMTLTFQKEVAERIIAEAAENQRCRLSIMAQAWTTPKLNLIIPRHAFVPTPEVDVGVVTFVPLKKPRTNHEFKFFEKVNRHLFSFRQKYSVKCAGTLFPVEYREELALMMYKLADVDPKTQAFNLTVEDVNRLASAYKFLCTQHPEISNYFYTDSRKVLSRKLTKSVNICDYVENNTCAEISVA